MGGSRGLVAAFPLRVASLMLVAVLVAFAILPTAHGFAAPAAVARFGASGRLVCSSRQRRPQLRMAGEESAADLLKAALVATKKESVAVAAAAAPAVGDIALSEDTDLSELRRVQEAEHRAVFREETYAAPAPLMKFMPQMDDRHVTLAARFGDVTRAQVVAAAAEGAVLADVSHSGALLLSGGDAARFINGQCTNKFVGAVPGDARPACFCNKVGRTIDLATVAVLGTTVLVLCSPSRAGVLFQSLDALIFPSDDVSLLEAPAAHFRLVGPRAGALLASTLSIPSPGLPPIGKCATFSFGGGPTVTVTDGTVTAGTVTDVTVIHGGGLAQRGGDPGYTIVASGPAAPALWSALAAGGDGVTPVLAGADAWEALRIMDGVPAPGKELTLDHNPLEAGLWGTVSFDKGCYIGQETIARLRTSGGVKQQLFSLSPTPDSPPIPDPAALLGAKLWVVPGAGDGEEGGGGRAMGVVTSVLAPEEGSGGVVVCLGYIGSKVGGAGTVLSTGEGGRGGVLLEARAIAFATRSEKECADTIFV